jgi:radical SAM-linked protein
VSRRTPEGPPPPPVVQRVRVRYAKRGRLRFASHRDFARAFERALRRAGAPVAYSAGFTPHPKVSYAGAAPTGAASEAEYLEVGLSSRVDPGALRAALDASLPPGLDVLACVEASGAGLPDRIDASLWELRFPGVRSLAGPVSEFLARDSVPVDRPTKDGTRSVDARAAVCSTEVIEGDCAILRCVVRHMIPAVRPDDIVSGLRAVAPLDLPAPVEATRLAQGLLDEAGRLSDPLVVS